MEDTNDNTIDAMKPPPAGEKTAVAKRLWWWLTSRKCVCGEWRLRGGTVEVGGVKHRLDGPCFHCDAYGEPLPPWREPSPTLGASTPPPPKQPPPAGRSDR
jgi:hypothetical protein